MYTELNGSSFESEGGGGREGGREKERELGGCQIRNSGCRPRTRASHYLLSIQPACPTEDMILWNDSVSVFPEVKHCRSECRPTQRETTVKYSLCVREHNTVEL